MHEIHDHKSFIEDDAGDKLRVFAVDEPGPGNACHEYTVQNSMDGESEIFANVQFQKGPLQANAFNGCSNESVLAIVADRLKGFQSGPYACRENALALTKIQEAIMWLHFRTKARFMRGVEGTSAK